ncbi:MAG: DUF2461 domain-containing protein [Bacteroidales bacterium]|jgi:uncharacterized protein (TIGR02453 family)|nr:DUF2461 domain-containing protein [Bacteroidales bacterium]
MKDIIDFLNELAQNNNREWFEAHKPTFKALQARFLDFTEALIEGIAQFDPSVKNVTAKESIYRIYRDVRFSPNKLPYKSHFAAYICQGGKKSGNAGYYFHIESKYENYIGEHLLAAGCHCPEPLCLKSIREDIEYNGSSYREAIKEAKGFTIEGNQSLKSVPNGFNKESEFADLLKLKDLSLMRPLSEKELCSPTLLENTIAQFKTVKSFNSLLNRSINYIREQE